MALRKPLVLVSGEIQQIQSGDTLQATVTEVGVITMTNSDAASTAIGDVMYNFGNDTLKKAKADAVGTMNAFAFATAVIATTTTGSFQTDGLLGGFTGLVAGTVYYLSAATAGLATATAPSTAGQYVVRLGTAVSTTELEIRIERPILL